MVNSETVLQAVGRNRAQALDKCQMSLRIPQLGIDRELYKLGKMDRSCRQVPHELTAAASERHVYVYRQLPENPRNVVSLSEL